MPVHTCVTLPNDVLHWPAAGMFSAYLKPVLMQVHAYVALPGGRTGYLSELRSGSEVLVADAGGRTRTALVGRAKIERRPLMLVEVSGP